MEYKGMKVGSFMKCNHQIKGLRFTDSLFMNVEWDVNFGFMTTSTDLDKVTRVVERSIIWLETLHDVIVISPDESKDVTNLVMGMTDNNVMFVPTRASDDIMIHLIHSKLQALMDGYCIVGEISLKASDNSIVSCFTPGTEMQASIPMDTYMDGFKRMEESNWWERNDGFCIEFALPDHMEADLKEVYADVTDPLDCIPLQGDDGPEDSDSAANVIKFGKDDS